MYFNKCILFYFGSFQLHIHFNESATSTYEYPSEQSLLEEMPPEPGDFDYRDPSSPTGPLDSPTEDINPAAGGTLRSTPAISSAVGTAGRKGRPARPRPYLF